MTDHGGPTGLSLAEVFQTIDSYIYQVPPTGYSFVPTITEIMGIIDYYLGFIGSGNTKTGCNFVLPVFGYQDYDGLTGTYSNYLYGTNALSPTNNGIADSITMYFHNGWETHDHARCGLYNAATKSLVAETEELYGPRNLGWLTFNFSSPKPQIYNTMQYYIVFFTASDVLNIGYKTITSSPMVLDKNETYPYWPTTTLDTPTKTYSYVLYCTYTPT